MYLYNSTTLTVAALLTLVGSMCVTGSAHALAVDQNNFSHTVTPGGPLEDGGDDQFDGGAIGDNQVDGTSYSGAISGSLPNFIIAPQTIGNVTISGRRDFLVPNGTTDNTTSLPGVTDYVYSRLYYSLTNTSGVPINTELLVNHNRGSDAGTIVHATSSGDTAISAADLWAITDDATDGGEDPAVGLLLADGTGLLPTSWDLSNDTTRAIFDLSLNPGETLSIMVFEASRNSTDTFPQTATRAQTQADILDLLADRSLQFSGLSATEASTVVNFVPIPGAVWLFGSGLLGLIGISRRKQSAYRN